MHMPADKVRVRRFWFSSPPRPGEHPGGRMVGNGCTRPGLAHGGEVLEIDGARYCAACVRDALPPFAPGTGQFFTGGDPEFFRPHLAGVPPIFD